jgi:uncharacterized protein (TIGR02145 family)
MTTKLFLKMYSRTAVRFCYCCCLLLLFAACSKDNYPQDSDTPPHAATTKTWVIESADGSIKQTWSDAIQIPECNKADYDGGSEDAPKADCRSYTYEGKTYYYYSWPYVNEKADALCSSPWRVPTKEDIQALANAFGCNATRYTPNPPCIEQKFVIAWGGSYGGIAKSTSITETGTHAYYWSSLEAEVEDGYSLAFKADGSKGSWGEDEKQYGLQVRCVK